MLGLLALFAWALTRDPKLISSPLIGKEAPLFALDLFDGGTFQLADQRGQVVVLNVWASWCCPACWNEAPRLEAAWRQYRDQGVVLGPMLVVPYLQLAKREEQALEGRFGPRYRLHQQRVPGFLPVAGG